MSKKKAGKSGITERAGDFAKNIWLAGLGAYGEAYDEVANQQKNLKELPALFKELVEKGAGIESSEHVPKKKRGDKTKASKKVDLSALEGETLEQRIRRMRESLSLNWPNQPTTDIQALEEKIDRLSGEVSEIKALLSAQLTAKQKRPTKKPARRQSSTKAKKTTPAATKAKAPAKKKSTASKKR